MARRKLIAGTMAGGLIVAVGLALVLVFCQRGPLPLEQEILRAYRPGASYQPLTLAYPLHGTVFPPEIAPATFRWHDSNAAGDGWVIALEFGDGKVGIHALTDAPQWCPLDAQWDEFKRRSREQEATITVLGFCRGEPATILSAGGACVSTSPDPVGAPLFYREVNLPFVEAVKDPTRIRWRLGEISTKDRPPAVLGNLPVCGNCHSFSADGAVLGMDVDYANDKGSYVVTPVAPETVLDASKIITWSDYRREDKEPTFGLLSQVSPDGRYVVSTVKDRSVFVATPDVSFSQLFFPIKGILAVYDRQTKTFEALRGADDPDFVQSNPAWSPDGKFIVFARSRAYRLPNLQHVDSALLTPEECQEFLKEGKTFLYDLYRVPFNGGRGGKAEPLEGAAQNGASNFFPKYSPDGKWIVFCQAKSFMLLQPDSALYIIPAAGGAARRMTCNTTRMNSWHSWSPNGRWLVFSSKANSPYTQLFLTHVDEQGRDSPPVLLDRFVGPDRAANIPEFLNAGPRALVTMREQFVNDVSYVRAGDQNVIAKDDAKAEEAYRRALSINPNNAAAWNNLGTIFMGRQSYAEATRYFAKAVELDPDSVMSRHNLANVLVLQHRVSEGIQQYRAILSLDPQHGKSQIALGTLLWTTNRIDEAVVHLSEGVRLCPEEPYAHFNFAQALFRLKRTEEAAAQYAEAIRLQPDFARAHLNRALALHLLGRVDEAISSAQAALEHARASGDNELAEKAEKSLRMYQAQRKGVSP